MTLCALGMSEEFRGTIAVNSLWPKIPVLVRFKLILTFENPDLIPNYFFRFQDGGKCDASKRFQKFDERSRNFF